MLEPIMIRNLEKIIQSLELPPADSPKTVTRSGSPPKTWMFSLIHSKANLWSRSPALADFLSFSRSLLANPNTILVISNIRIIGGHKTHFPSDNSLPHRSQDCYFRQNRVRAGLGHKYDHKPDRECIHLNN